MASVILAAQRGGVSGWMRAARVRTQNQAVASPRKQVQRVLSAVTAQNTSAGSAPNCNNAGLAQSANIRLT